MVRLILVRHGQTDAKLNRLIQGQGDGPLNATGRQQAEALGVHLQGVKLDLIISSTLQRAYDTARAIARHHQLEVIRSAFIVEWNCGLLDGLPAEEFRQKIKESGLPLSQFRPPGGETLAEVRQRAATFMTEMLVPRDQQTILVCSHGDFLRALLSLMRGITIEEAASLHLDNASYTVVEHVNGSWETLGLNQLAGKSTLLVENM